MNGIQEVMGSIPTVSTKQKALVISTGAFCCVFSLCNGLYKLCPRTELLIVDVKLHMDLIVSVDFYPLKETVHDHFLASRMAVSYIYAQEIMSS